MNLWQKKKNQGVNPSDKNSLWVLYGAITIGYFLSFTIGVTKIGRIQPWNTYFAVSMGLFAAGLVIRLLSIAALKRYFTYSVATVQEHKIVPFYGTLFSNVPDYNGSQILVDRIAVDE